MIQDSMNHWYDIVTSLVPEWIFSESTQLTIHWLWSLVSFVNESKINQVFFNESTEKSVITTYTVAFMYSMED